MTTEFIDVGMGIKAAFGSYNTAISFEEMMVVNESDVKESGWDNPPQLLFFFPDGRLLMMLIPSIEGRNYPQYVEHVLESFKFADLRTFGKYDGMRWIVLVTEGWATKSCAEEDLNEATRKARDVPMDDKTEIKVYAYISKEQIVQKSYSRKEGMVTHEAQSEEDLNKSYLGEMMFLAQKHCVQVES